MTAAEHAAAAAETIAQALSGLPDPSDDSHADRIARAQVHATLAVAHAIRSLQRDPSGVPKFIDRPRRPPTR